MIPGTGIMYHVPGIYSKQQFVAGTPIVLLYEKGDAVRIEARPPSPNTCRLCARSSRGLFRPQARAATAPGCRACSASPEHRVGSVLIGQDQTQAHSSSSTRGSSTTPDDGSHIHRIVRPRCRTESSWLRAGRVWACARPLQSVQAAAAAELACRGRVVVLVFYVLSTAAVGRVILDYCI